jgi:tetratricopeptide (TPR) repeat protein
MDGEGKADDLATMRLAAELNLRLNHLDLVRSYLGRIAGSPAASSGDRAWANRTHAALLLGTNRRADRDRALALVDGNLAESPESVEDQSLRATILALWPARQGEAIATLQRLAGADRLGDEPRFLLAQLYLSRGEGAKYEDQMLGLLNRKDRDPRHLAHFVKHWIDRNQLDQADRWLAELKQADLRSLLALELEARVLDLRKRRPELLALLQARGRDVPDQLGAVADLLSRHGFATKAESAYRTFAARDAGQPERSLALAQFLARQDRVPEAMEILKKACSICRPEQVASAALRVFNAPSADDVQRRQVEAWVAEAVRKRPDATLLACKLGMIWIYRGRYNEAEGLLRRLLADQPDNADALNSLAWLLALRNARTAQEAVGLINRAIELQGETPSLTDTRAVVRIQLGQIDQAVADLLASRKKEPNRPSFAFHLAWAYQASGRSDQARVELRAAERLGLRVERLDPLELAIFQKLRKELAPG